MSKRMPICLMPDVIAFQGVSQISPMIKPQRSIDAKSETIKAYDIAISLIHGGAETETALLFVTAADIIAAIPPEDQGNQQRVGVQRLHFA